MKFPLDWLFFEKWWWFTILGCCAVIVSPLVVLYAVVSLPGPLRGVAVLGIILGWSVAGGYKDWVKARRKEEKEKPFHKQNAGSASP